MLSSRFVTTFSSLKASAFGWQSAAAILTGVLLMLSFPPFDYDFLAWFALAPLLYALSSGMNSARAFGCGWVAGWVFFFFATNWITHSMIQFGGMPVIAAYAVAALFATILALFPALFATLIAQSIKTFGYRALLLAPFAWTATEWLRGIVTGVTWNALGVTQVGNTFLIEFARLGGAYLLTAILIFPAALLLLWLDFIQHAKNPGKQFLFLLIVITFLALLFYFFIKHSTSINRIYPKIADLLRSDSQITVAAIQPNIPLTIYETPDKASRYFADTLKLTRDAIAQAKDKKPELIVWSESPLVLNYENDPNVREQLDKLVTETRSHLIFSAMARAGDQYFNSAQTIAPPTERQPLRPLKRYDKIRLVPFGEYVPFRRVLGYFVPAMIGDFTPGQTAVVNSLRLRTKLAVIQNEAETNNEMAIERTTNFMRTGTFICYEAAYPNLVRQFVNNGATLLVNISNDAWFGNTAGARQHLAHARMRAIENNRDLIRVTNSGISALITASGDVKDELPMFTPGAKLWQAQTNNRLTFYTKHGDWFAIGCTIISIVALAASLIRQFRNRPQTNADSAD